MDGGRSWWPLAVCSLVVPMLVCAARGTFGDDSTGVADEAAIPGHVQQGDIDEGRWTISNLVEAGRRLFVARFTSLDGAGRPMSTGRNEPQGRASTPRAYDRGLGPDANSCASCHRDPVIGGSGDFVANVFVGLGERQQPTSSIAATFSNERGTPEMHGTGVVELLAREMSHALQAIRDEAMAVARSTRADCRRQLMAKGVSFGWITALADGSLKFDEIEGVDHDLVVKPFGAKGIFGSLREFTINALNLHHGMQAEERFGHDQTGESDYDRDGIRDEITVGDVTALTLFQALLPMPGRAMPMDETARENVTHGERLFREVGCAACHVPEMTLDSPIFTEPGPFNVRGTLKADERTTVVEADLSRDGQTPRPTPGKDGKIVVHVFSDFKRHVIADAQRPHLANETVQQRRVPTNVFLTKRLWAVGNTDPYGHRGDVTTIDEIIRHHGGEAAAARERYEAMSPTARRAMVSFLRTLQVLPEGASIAVTEAPARPLPYGSPVSQKEKER